VLKLGIRFEVEEKENKPMRKKHHLFLSIIGGWMLFMLCSNKAQGQFEVKGKLCIPDQECKSDSVSFADTLKTSTAWRWDFGDPGAGAGNFSTKKNPKHLYQSPGVKLVTLVRTVNGVQETVTKTITIGVPPPQFQNWRPDTMICKEDLGKLVLNPYPTNAPNGAKYMWFPKGDTTQTIKVDSSGCYSVEVTNAEGCSYQDRITVRVCLESPAPPSSKWFFGNNAGLDFQGNNPTPITTGQLNTPEGTASISNKKGKLLFYTDGVKIYDINGAIMPSKGGDTTSLGGSPNSTQSALIVPKPICRGCEYLYYVFTTSEINGKKRLSYSVVDMRGNAGKGEIVEKNVILNDNTTEQITSIFNPTDSTYWVVARDYKSNVFRLYNATKAGLSQPKLIPLGSVQDTTTKAEGYMKFSTPDTTGISRLAVVIPGPPRNLVELYNFNTSTGQISGPVKVDLGPAPPKAYGVEFSPDGTKMYVSLQKGATDTTYSKLWQFDITGDSARIADSKILIDSSATKIYGALQIGSDSRIYMAIKDSQYLGVINAPDEDSQDEVEFVANGVFLGGKTSQLGLPNSVVEPSGGSGGPSIMYRDTCANQPTNFQASPLCDPIKDTYTWNFGDGSAPMSGQNQQVQHTYRLPGTYTVSLNLKNKCKDTTITQRITIIATPDPIKLKSPIDTCVNRLVLDAGVQAEQYLWLRNGVPISREKTISLRPNGGSGAYRVLAANGVEGQCFSQGNTQITLRQPPAYSLGPDTSLCVGGGTVVLNAKPTPTNWNKFLWNTGETTQLITVNTPGFYSVQVTINAGTPQACVNEDTIRVRPLPKARMQATLTPPTGCTTRDGRIVIGAITPNGNYNYSWFGANDTPLTGTGNTLANLAEGTYKVRLTGNSAVCATDSSFSLKVVKTLRLQPTIVNARCTLPSSGAINLNTLAGTPTRYVWTTAQGAGIGTSAPLLSNLTPGKYNVKVTDSGGCDTTLNDITVGIIPEKFLDLGPDREKCIGDTALLIPALPALAGNQYKWSTGETTNRITVSRAGTYTLTVTNSVTGCTDTDDFGYSLAPRPIYDLTRDVGICDLDAGATATLIVRPTTPNLRYRWFPPIDGTTPRVTVSQVGVYRVSITSPASCEVIDTVKVVVRCEPRIYIPDVFTPNGDGNNDVLKVYGDHLTDFELKIFNRWGEVIFYTNDITKQWDGKYRDELYPPMVYPYVVSFKSEFFPERPRSSQRGAVMLLR
jgi:gliding motility-associated-like protein